MLTTPAAGADPGSGGSRLTGTVTLHATALAPRTLAQGAHARRAAKIPIKVYGAPTSGAGLGRITTAPNGDMWFVESDGYKIGRIKPSGRIDEWTLPVDDDCDDPDTGPSCTHTDDPEIEDLDVASNGLVWLVIDSGWRSPRST